MFERKPRFPIRPVTDESFARYGRIVEGIEMASAMAYLAAATPVPDGGVYVASCPELEKLPLGAAVSAAVFGGMAVQVGYCNGMTLGLDALEYHKSPEFTVADAEVVLLVSEAGRLKDGHLSPESIEAFSLPAGVAVELHAGTLHFAPCRTGPEGYRSIVILPEGTNAPLPADRVHGVAGEARLLFARNKWLVAHPACERLMARGAFPGLDGSRIAVRF